MDILSCQGILACNLVLFLYSSVSKNIQPGRLFLDIDCKDHKVMVDMGQPLVVLWESLCIGKMDHLLILEDKCKLERGCWHDIQLMRHKFPDKD